MPFLVSSPVAVIVDLVRSRQIASRAEAQPLIEDTFGFVNGRVNPVQPIRATIGDEFQGVFSTLGDALEATLLTRLALPSGLDCRFGIGSGAIETVGEGMAGRLQDGPGWWLAREAINEAHTREKLRNPTLRSWFRAATDEGGASGARLEPAYESVVNAYLLTRDHLISTMNDRARRVTLGTALGRSQSELAADEKVSQSAISQAMRNSGGSSLLSSLDALKGGAL
ncbi:SatD family protein [Subtercola vilae]|nr:SatD family protein [Subtercola vilae]